MLIRLVLNAEVRHRRKRWSEQDELTIVRKRQTLNARIEKHRDEATRYLPPHVMDHVQDHETNGLDEAWIDDNDADADDAASVTADLEQLTITMDTDEVVPERRSIYLPSVIGHKRCGELGLRNMVKSELALRQGEANDALQAIRIAIGEKSFRFRKQLRNSKSKVQKTRSWDAIHAVDRRLQLKSLVYKRARHALISLGAPKTIRDRYQELKSKDLHTNTAIQEPNARGQRNQELSWIWKMPGISFSNHETLLHECEMFKIYWLIPALITLFQVYRVSWIRAKSRHDRWREEVSISSHEMVWVPLWFQYRAQEWRDRAAQQAGPGLSAYAYRQATTWERMKQVALARFHKANPEISSVFGYDNINML
jgi:hypothetical protein